MNPLVLELACRDLKMTDGAVIDLKKQLRLARNNQAKLRRENANLRVQVFNFIREQRDLVKELAEHIVAAHTISHALAKLNAFKVGN